MEKLGIRVFLFAVILSVALVAAMPRPGGDKKEHIHFIIHVPELIHKHKHTHVKKIHIHKKPEEDSGHEHVEEW